MIPLGERLEPAVEGPQERPESSGEEPAGHLTPERQELFQDAPEEAKKEKGGEGDPAEYTENFPGNPQALPAPFLGRRLHELTLAGPPTGGQSRQERQGHDQGGHEGEGHG